MVNYKMTRLELVDITMLLINTSARKQFVVRDFERCNFCGLFLVRTTVGPLVPNQRFVLLAQFNSTNPEAAMGHVLTDIASTSQRSPSHDSKN